MKPTIGWLGFDSKSFLLSNFRTTALSSCGLAALYYYKLTVGNRTKGFFLPSSVSKLVTPTSELRKTQKHIPELLLLSNFLQFPVLVNAFIIHPYCTTFPKCFRPNDKGQCIIILP
jgi:hypothetical protein